MPKFDISDNPKAPLVPSCRLLLGFMVMLAISFLYSLRIILSISMICMVKPIPPAFVNHSTWNGNFSEYELSGQTSPAWTDSISGHDWTTSNSTVTERPSRGEFEWSRAFQGAIFSSYFYGYMSTQVIGGILSGKYGAKHVIGTGVLISGILTLITPAATRLNAYLLIVIRVLLGAAGGVFLPSGQAFWGRWAPQFERSLLVSMSFLGITLGNIIALLFSPLFCELESDNGWPWSFYSMGIFAIVFWIGWQFLVYSSPDDHPRISEREKVYVKAATGTGPGAAVRPPVPWLKIITSPAVWAILVAQTCNTWFLFTSITLPLYMKDVLKYNIKENGLFLCFPYFVDMVTMPLAGQFSDMLRRKKILSTIVLRKLFQSISCLGSATLIIALSYMDYERRYVAVALLTMIYPIQNLCRSGYGVNPQDIAPRYSGEIFGITTTAGTISGIISPLVVGLLTKNGTRSEWQQVFFISSGFFIFGGVFFFIFARGELQPWAVVEKPVELQLAKNRDDLEDNNDPNDNSDKVSPKNGVNSVKH